MFCSPASTPPMHFMICDKNCICTTGRVSVELVEEPKQSYSQLLSGITGAVSLTNTVHKHEWAHGSLPMARRGTPIVEPREWASVSFSPGFPRIAPDPCEGHTYSRSITSGNIVRWHPECHRVRGRRSCCEIQGKTISELNRADYRTVSGRTKAGYREVSILPVEEQTWENRKGKELKWSGCVWTVFASVYMCIHICVYVLLTDLHPPQKERNRMRSLVLFVFM